ncbi:UNVERIFIED_CONTAM: hypothetical protein NCL1_41863 [Trichonephila clavipes]
MRLSPLFGDISHYFILSHAFVTYLLTYPCALNVVFVYFNLNFIIVRCVCVCD